MSDAAERAFQEFVRGGSVRSQGLSVPMGHDCFEVLCCKNRNPTKPQVKRWYYMLRRPLDDTNVYCTLNLVRRALVDWPKMGAAIAKMAGQDIAERRKEKQLRKKFAAVVASKLKKQTALDCKQRGTEADSARRNSSDKRCAVKMNRRNSNVAKR